MPKKKQPEIVPPWLRPDLIFTPEGVKVVSDPLPLIPKVPEGTTQEKGPRTSASLKTREGDYTVKELAKEWGFSPEKIRQIFRNEPGVVKLRDENFYKKRKRSYVSLRIPAEVAARVKQRLS